MNYNHRKGEEPRTPPKNKAQAKEYRLEDFKDTYEHLLKEHGTETHKIITTIQLKEYYEIGLLCIHEEISIAEFIRTAIKTHKKDIPRFAKLIKRKPRKGTRKKKKQQPKQGVLFE